MAKKEVLKRTTLSAIALLSTVGGVLHAFQKDGQQQSINQKRLEELVLSTLEDPAELSNISEFENWSREQQAERIATELDSRFSEEIEVRMTAVSGSDQEKEQLVLSEVELMYSDFLKEIEKDIAQYPVLEIFQDKNSFAAQYTWQNFYSLVISTFEKLGTRDIRSIKSSERQQFISYEVARARFPLQVSLNLFEVLKEAEKHSDLTEEFQFSTLTENEFLALFPPEFLFQHFHQATYLKKFTPEDFYFWLAIKVQQQKGIDISLPYHDVAPYLNSESLFSSIADQELPSKKLSAANEVVTILSSYKEYNLSEADVVRFLGHFWTAFSQNYSLSYLTIDGEKTPLTFELYAKEIFPINLEILSNQYQEIGRESSAHTFADFLDFLVVASSHDATLINHLNVNSFLLSSEDTGSMNIEFSVNLHYSLQKWLRLYFSFTPTSERTMSSVYLELLDRSGDTSLGTLKFLLYLAQEYDLGIFSPNFMRQTHVYLPLFDNQTPEEIAQNKARILEAIEAAYSRAEEEGLSQEETAIFFSFWAQGFGIDLLEGKSSVDRPSFMIALELYKEHPNLVEFLASAGVNNTLGRGRWFLLPNTSLHLYEQNLEILSQLNNFFSELEKDFPEYRQHFSDNMDDQEIKGTIAYSMAHNLSEMLREGHLEILISKGQEYWTQKYNITFTEQEKVAFLHLYNRMIMFRPHPTVIQDTTDTRSFEERAAEELYRVRETAEYVSNPMFLFEPTMANPTSFSEQLDQWAENITFMDQQLDTALAEYTLSPEQESNIRLIFAQVFRSRRVQTSLYQSLQMNLELTSEEKDQLETSITVFNSYLLQLNETDHLEYIAQLPSEITWNSELFHCIFMLLTKENVSHSDIDLLFSSLDTQRRFITREGTVLYLDMLRNYYADPDFTEILLRSPGVFLRVLSLNSSTATIPEDTNTLWITETWNKWSPAEKTQFIEMVEPYLFQNTDEITLNELYTLTLIFQQQRQKLVPRLLEFTENAIGSSNKDIIVLPGIGALLEIDFNNPHTYLYQTSTLTSLHNTPSGPLPQLPSSGIVLPARVHRMDDHVLLPTHFANTNVESLPSSFSLELNTASSLSYVPFVEASHESISPLWDIQVRATTLLVVCDDGKGNLKTYFLISALSPNSMSHELQKLIRDSLDQENVRVYMASQPYDSVGYDIHTVDASTNAVNIASTEEGFTRGMYQINADMFYLLALDQ